jgi:translation initiation factor 1 (eIF-1/SUI1)
LVFLIDIWNGLIVYLLLDVNVRRKEMRDNKAIETYLKEKLKRIKEMSLFRNLKKEVETGANGTQEYVIKQGPNKDKIAK